MLISRTKYSLNAISHDSAIRLINEALKKGVKVKEVYVDTVGPPDTYQTKLQVSFLFNFLIKLSYEKLFLVENISQHKNQSREKS